MLKLGLIIGVLVSFISESFGQDRYYTFYDNCILRTEPSVESKVIMSIPIKTHMHSYDGYNNYNKQDTINNLPGYWIGIDYKGHKGYIWQHLLSDNYFKTHDGELVLLNTTQENIIDYKVFYGDSLLVEDHIQAPFNFKQKAIVDCSPLLELQDKYMVNDNGLLRFFTFKNKKLVVDKTSNTPESLQPVIEKSPLKIGLVNGDYIRVRALPNDSSEVLFKMQTNDIVEIDSIGHTINLGEQEGNWVQVMHHNKKGYVWGAYIDTPYVLFIQPETQLKFICFYHKLVVANDENQWIDEIILKNPVESERVNRLNSFNTTVHSSPFKSSKKHDVVLTLEYSDSEMDVGWRTTKQFLWNGHNLVKLYETNEEEEMGYDHFESYTPILRRIDDIQDPVVKIEHTTTQFMEGYGDVTSYLGKRSWQHNKGLYLYAFKADGLKQLPSRIDFLEDELNKQSGSFIIQDYQCLDFNGDGRKDFVFIANKKNSKEQRNDNLSQDIYLGYAIAQSDTSFFIPQMNQTLLKWSSVNSIELKTNGFMVWSSSWKNKEGAYNDTCSFMRVKFKFNTTEDRFYIESKQMNRDLELFYKKNPILLEHTW